MDLLGKIAIVTGGGKGLGWAIAERLAKEGRPFSDHRYRWKERPGQI